MKKNLKQEWYVYAILAVTFLTRFLFIELRPPHFDEGINGFFVDQMWAKGFYDYDPTNYHGPLHFYFLQMFEVLFGRSIGSFRMVTATLSVLTVFVTLLHREFIGRAAIWAALVIALSPGAMFMGRYAIHEAWLPFSLVLVNYGFMRWFHKKDFWSQFWVFAGIALALLNKETAVIHFFVWALSLGYLLWKFPKEFNKANFPTTEDVFIGLTWVLIAIFIVYSGFGLQVDQFTDFFKGFLPWMQTGTKGMGHEKDWYYWLQIAIRYEPWVLFSLLFGFIYFFKKNAWINYFYINFVGTLIVYSLIRYKTPWCSISVFAFAPFLFGMVIDKGQSWIKWTSVFLVPIILIYQVYQLVNVNYVNYTSNDEMYVYVHTTKDYYRITKPVEKLIHDKPEMKNMTFVIQMESPWPLNWQFQKFPNIKYGFENIDMKNVAFFVVDRSRKDLLESKLQGKYLKYQMRLRHHMDDIFVYFYKDTFEKYMQPGDIVGKEITK